MTTFMKIKVSEASGAILDYMVAKAIGFDVYYNERLNGIVMDGFWVSGYYPGDLNSWVPLNVLSHSTSWALSGPLIEREQLWITGPYRDRKEWKCGSGLKPDWDYAQSEFKGPTPLIAAMRCLVASKLGEEIDIPEELYSQ